MNASDVQAAYIKAFPYLMTPVECKDRIYEIVCIEEIENIFLTYCYRHRDMVFSNEISDCDDFVLQAYADFKWYWSRININGELTKEKYFKRMYNAHPPIGMGFGIKFRGRMMKHSIITIYTDPLMYIYDPMQREFYLTDSNLDAVLHVSMQ